MKILILTECNSEIGFGHVTRCLSLYQAFKLKELSIELMVNGDSTIEPLLKDTEYTIFNWLDDSSKIFDYLNDFDIVIVDSYLADAEFYKCLSEIVSLGVYIDDNNRISYPKGLVVNGSIFADRLDYPSLNGVDYLLGSEFISLRREFWIVPVKKLVRNVESVMVTFGGDDLRNLTPHILRMLVEEYPKLYKKVVIGGGFKKNSKILDVIDCNTELIYYPDARVMLKLMLESDIAVSAGGQTLYELARVGVPTIAIGVASNQTHNLENWHKIGFIEYVGFWNDINLLNNVINKMNSFNDVSTRIRKCEIGRGYVDGKGAFRIVRYCLNKYYTDKIRLRTLESTDINNIYNLSNDDIIRLNSFNTDKIRFEDHVKWFEQKILDNNNLFLVTEIDNDFAGQVRFDFKGDGAVVSLSITKKYRKLGLGVNILEKSIEYLRLNASFIKIINAYIKEDNKSSVNLFEKTGFKFVKMVNLDNQRALNYIYKI